MTRQLSRREVLRYGAGAASLLSVPSVLAACSSSKSSSPRAAKNKAPAQEGFPQPHALTSQGGELNVTLTAKQAVVDMNAPQKITTVTFDGIVPGYTWELQPGDTLNVDLVNNLPPMKHAIQSSMNVPRPHEWDHTNLHTHGLHVSPADKADNVFIDIARGDHFQYQIPIPKDHTGGIFWYHPHRHGAVTQQVRGGMAGMIIVRGAIDAVPEVHAAKEQIMVLQAIELNKDYQLAEPIPNPSTVEAFFPRNQTLYTVNGVLNPKLTMYPGEVQRWRVLNGAEGKFMSLRLDGHQLNAIAWDGLTLDAPEPLPYTMLAAGNRGEFLVKAGAAGTYQLVLSPGSSQLPDIPGMPDSVTSTTAPTSAELKPRSILTVEVTGSGPEMNLPTSLPAYNPPILPIAKTRDFSFTNQRGPDKIEFISFGIDGVPFDPDRPPYQMKVGTAEEWNLVNAIDTRYPRHAHGLHIHTNPFRVTKINGQVLPKPLWRDTMVLTGGDHDSITFQHNFDDFTGKFVEHCHVLGHEDLGMMESLEVTP
jgi:FtsP/CotA-like multicopper oxidase with cupredoxin domain